MAYRPPGRNNRSRNNAESDVFEGLPVRQWGQLMTQVSLAPPQPVEVEAPVADRWADPPLPRDSALLHPWTQHLLRVARSGRVITKRKADEDIASDDENAVRITTTVTTTTGTTTPNVTSSASNGDNDDSKQPHEHRLYTARRWKPVPETLLEPEHKHFEFLAKRRKGVQHSSSLGMLAATVVPLRQTRVQRVGNDGEIFIYSVMIPVGQTIEGELLGTPSDATEAKPVKLAPGTTIEGLGVANDDGVLVAEHLRQSATIRRNRPPPKKKAGPGRGKKRVTFTNADGSTYTKIVPNATKIVPKPGQTIKHVAKGEEAIADVSAEDAAAMAAAGNAVHEGEGMDIDEGDEGEDEGDDDGDDDDDREEGEISEDETTTAAATPIPSGIKSRSETAPPVHVKQEELDSMDHTPAPALPIPNILGAGTSNTEVIMDVKSPGPPIKHSPSPNLPVSDSINPSIEQAMVEDLPTVPSEETVEPLSTAVSELPQAIVEPVTTELSNNAPPLDPMDVDPVESQHRLKEPTPAAPDALADLQKSLGFSSEEPLAPKESGALAFPGAPENVVDATQPASHVPAENTIADISEIAPAVVPEPVATSVETKTEEQTNEAVTPIKQEPTPLEDSTANDVKQTEPTEHATKAAEGEDEEEPYSPQLAEDETKLD